MSRRYYEYLFTEISVTVEHRISGYGLWLLIWESGGDPDDLTREQVRVFVDRHLSALLSEEGCRLDRRARARLEKRLLRFDPRYPTPEERLAA